MCGSGQLVEQHVAQPALCPSWINNQCFLHLQKTIYLALCLQPDRGFSSQSHHLARINNVLLALSVTSRRVDILDQTFFLFPFSEGSMKCDRLVTHCYQFYQFAQVMWDLDKLLTVKWLKKNTVSLVLSSCISTWGRTSYLAKCSLQLWLLS